MILTEDDILDALRVCYDPELRINIVDLGRVDRVLIETDTQASGIVERSRVSIQLLPRDEEQDAILSAIIANRLLGLPEISRVEVTLKDALPWTSDRMNSFARRELGKQRGLVQLG